MKQIELNGKTLLFVEVPKGAADYRPLLMIYGRYGMSIAFRERKTSPHVPLPEGKWQFVGTTDNLTEELAAELVETIIGYDGTNCFYDYEKDCYCETAIASFQSWLRANNISGNNAILSKI